MRDVLTKTQRSYNMSRIRGKDTSPEMIVRRLVHAMGFRYRLHVRSLPGAPDMVFRSRRQAIFVHGCFWHRHSCKLGRPMPATRRAFWKAKLEGNKSRDTRQRRALRRMGWKILTVWECQTGSRKLVRLRQRIATFLNGRQE